MRGTDQRSGELFSYVGLEQRVRADHPLRAIRSYTRSWRRDDAWTTSASYDDLFAAINVPDGSVIGRNM